MKTKSATYLSFRLSLLLIIVGLCVTANLFAGTKQQGAIQQCADGNAATPSACNTTGKLGYTSVNIGDRQSHYGEGDSLPVRILFNNLVVGQIYTVRIAYDFTTNGKYAVDYLTSVYRTESINNNPCVGVPGCVAASPNSTAPIPVDSQVAAGPDRQPFTGDDITQIPGDITLFGGSGLLVAEDSFVGNLDADSFQILSLSFTATVSNPVIAYGAHVAIQSDWGTGATASSVAGSRYQNSVVNFSGGSVGKSNVTMLLSQ